MNGITVNLLVMQAYGANDPGRPECGRTLRTHTGIGCQVAILGDPTGQRANWNDNTETLFDALDDPNPWFTAIVEGQTLEDQFQWIGFSFGALRHEHSVAIVTAPELHCFELLVTQAFAHYVSALTEDTTFEPSADDGGFGLSRL